MSDIRVCWIFGNFFESRKTIYSLKQMLGDHSCVVYTSDVPGEQVEAEVLGNILFDNNNLIILRFIPKFIGHKTKIDQQKRMMDIVSRIPHGNILVFDGIDPKEYPQLFKYITKSGKVFQYPIYMKQGEAQQWIKTRLETNKMTISDVDISIILNVLYESGKGIKVDKLYLIVQKLQDYMGTKKKIERDDILAISDTCYSYVIWDLLNAIDARSYSRAMKLISIACTIAKDVVDTIREIFSFCAWRFKLLLFAKDMMNKTTNMDEITTAIMKLHKFERTGTQTGTVYKVKTNKDGSFVPMASAAMVANLFKSYSGHVSVINRYTARDLLRIVNCCEEAMFLLRLEPTTPNAMLMIDNLIMTVCGILPDSVLVPIRKK